MKLTYIHHSGFLLETDTCAMLFDYVEGTLPDIPWEKPLYVLVSHAHPDHYHKKIFTQVAQAAEKASVPLHYLISDDIRAGVVPDHLRAQVTFLAPHHTWEDDVLRAETLVSNDTGVAWMLSAGGVVGSNDAGISSENHRLSVYFAGDLNAWNWDGDAEDMALIKIYHDELARIRGRHFDVAFIPVDPRLEDDYLQGVTDFFDYCDADHIVPMHCWGKYEIIEKARALADRYPYLTRMLPIRGEGEVFEV